MSRFYATPFCAGALFAKKRMAAASVVVALWAVLLLALTLVLPGVAFADNPNDEDALYEPEVVSVSDDPSIPATQGYVSYQKTSGKYKVVLVGVTEANKESLADAVLAHADTATPVKFLNESFVDAEKYSTSCHGFDKFHCWLGSTANVLTLTGWAPRYVNPLRGARFANEDDLFAFLSAGFQDATCLPNLAYSYFFDGLFGGTRNSSIRTTETSEAKPFAGVSHVGFDPQICSSAFVERLELDDTLSALSALEGLGDYGLEMSISGDTSHSVTAVGAVIDQDKQGVDRTVAVLIADTDNEPPTSDEPPTDFIAANEAKSRKANSYTLYRVAAAESDGRPVALLQHYLKYKDQTHIGSFTRVGFFSAERYDSAIETSPHATRDASTTGDIVLSSLSVFDEEFKDTTVYTLADKLTLQAVISSVNANVDFNAEATGRPYLENRVEAYRDGQLVGTIDEAAWVDLAQGIGSAFSEYLSIDLSPYDFMRVPGSYELKFILNTGSIAQAYVMNDNSPRSVRFTIVGDEGDDEGSGDEGEDEGEPGADEGDQVSRDAGDDNHVAKTLAATGDPVGVLLLVAFAAAFASIIILSPAHKRFF